MPKWNENNKAWEEETFNTLNQSSDREREETFRTHVLNELWQISDALREIAQEIREASKR